MGLLADAFSYGDSLKRKVGGLLADPIGTIELGINRLKEDNNNTLNLFANAYPMAGDKTVLNTPAQKAAMQKQLADYASTVGIAGMFVGPKSQTWDKAAAAKAQELAKKGADPRKIWSETGTWKAPDGMWRQEIDDSAAKFKRSNVSDPAQFADVFDEAASRSNGVPMGNALDHSTLYKAYPEQTATRFKVEGQGPSISGSYRDADRLVSISDPYGAKMGDSPESVALHELQHSIQQREGWAKGGSPKDVGGITNQYQQAKAAFDEALKTRTNPNADEIAKANAAQIMQHYGPKLSELKQLSDPLSAYRSLAGEAEARATQARMSMDAAQRRATFPEDSYDVPINNLILRGMGGY